MKKTDELKKFRLLKEPDVNKELANLRQKVFQIQETQNSKHVHLLRIYKKSIARLLTVSNKKNG